ncbi:MAG: hypothetical protein QOJ02_4237 [Acidobacteriota bacterium]|jgi:hypothetical protein|nr:hypothetical protein [Acidobacteriota bacterium]
MRVAHIRHPLSGERIIGVDPPLNPSVDAQWRRRLNLYTGRALSDAALTTEQSGRSGRLAARGQMVSPGVVNGLIVGLESPPAINIDIKTLIRLKKDPEALRQSYFFHISSGAGIMPSGEDVVVSRNVRVAVGDVPVYTTVESLTKVAQPQSSKPDQPVALPADTVFGERRVESKPDASLVLKPRRLGPPLIKLGKAGIVVPRASILLLQPITLKRVGEFDDEDPCEQDPQNYAFEDWQLVDGCQLVLYTWPIELTDRLPFPEDSPQWRNRLAYSIFEAEMNNADPRELLPWEEIGLPIGLVGFDGDGLPLFVDRFSVVRSGGKPKRRSVLVPDISDIKEGKEPEAFEKINQYRALVPGAGQPFIWQARLQQFAEQLVEAMRDNKPIADVSNQFRFLPPAGLLPKEALTVKVEQNPDKAVHVGQIQNNFFPNRFSLDAVPVPLEQLDVAINQSAALSPFDTNNLDRLRVLVPVPQIYYEPNLLKEEKPDPEFEKNIATSLRKLGKWMKRRSDIHQIGKEINAEINGPENKYPESELMGEDEKSINQNLPADPKDTDDPSDIELNKVEETYETTPPLLVPKVFKDLKDRLNLGPDFPRKVLIGEIKGVPQPDMLAALGLKGFIDYLDQKVKQADDIIDFGFVRVQTDIYRYRQLMLGVTNAVRLATSPALASIAKGETAVATKEEIINFIQSARTSSANMSLELDAAPLSSGELPPAIAHSSPQAKAKPTVTAEADVHTPAAEIAATFAGSFAFPQISATVMAGIQSTVITKQATAATLFRPTVSLAATFARDSITQQTAIVGRPLDFRTVTVAERIKQAPAPEAKDFTVSSKYEVLRALEELAKIIFIDDLVLPGFYDYQPAGGGNLNLQTRPVDLFDRVGKKTTVQMNVEISRTFKFVVENRLSAQVLSGLHDLDPANGDESAFFAAAVRASDHTVAYLRIVEGRIQAYRNIIADCRKVLSELLKLASQVGSRLNAIEDHLAEMRHDLAVARALKADEDLRVNNINQRRVEIIKEHVAFFAFYRERTTDLHEVDVKVRELDPAEVVSPVPACLAREVSPPPELHAVADLLRDAPVKWFTYVHPLLDKFDRLEFLHRAVLSAKVRANTPPPVVEFAPRISASFGFFGLAIGKVIRAQQVVVSQLRTQVAQLDLSAFTAQSWQVARDQAREVVSFGDLIDGNHGRGDVSQQAAREFADITHVAACLYSALSVVLPVIRLNWAERISEFDAAADLRNLGSLPRWGEIAYLDRREMQTYTDWLFSRVDRKQPEAISLINDLVRVCILLASHAPVNQIVSAKVSQKTEVSEGKQVTLSVDPARVKIGMHVLMYRAGQVAARGIVEDLTSGQTAARITQVYSASKTTSLEVTDQVQIAEAGAFNRNPLAFFKATVKVK